MNKRLKLFAIISACLFAALMLLFFIGYGYEKPSVKEADFPISLRYELHGEIYTITDSYHAYYDGADNNPGSKEIYWHGYLEEQGQNTFYWIDQNEKGSFTLVLNIMPGYLMGDPHWQHCYSDGRAEADSFRPTVYYWDNATGTEIRDEKAVEELGMRIIDWDYPQPIENSFHYAGFKLNGDMTAVLMGFALLLSVLGVIIVRKKEGLVYGNLDKAALALNIVISVFVFPVITLTCMMWQHTSTNTGLVGELELQIAWLLPGLFILGIGASILLRRIGKSRAGFFTQFAGIIGFIILILINSVALAIRLG